MINDNLENYYCGDDAWTNFTLLYCELPDSENTYVLKELLQDGKDLSLTKAVEGKVGQGAIEWIYRNIPALNNLRPIDCINSPHLLKRLKTMLMRM